MTYEFEDSHDRDVQTDELLRELKAIRENQIEDPEDDDCEVTGRLIVTAQEIVEALHQQLLTLEAEKRPRERTFLCFTAIIETGNPNIQQVADVAERVLRQAFGPGVIGTEWTVRREVR